MKNYNVTAIKSLLDTAKSALIVVPTMSVDSIGSALGLALALKKAGKTAQVLSLQKPDQNYSKLSGLELITDSYNPADLVVTVSYPLDQIDQVSYNDDGGKLNLVVKTKSGATKIDQNQISINNSSGTADICFMLGDEAPLGDKASIVNSGNWVYIAPIAVQKTWAKATLIDPDAPFSEIFTFLLPMLGLTLDTESGKDILIGLRVATQSFSVNVSPESFEAGAICLRATQPESSNPATAGPKAPVVEPVNLATARPIENTDRPVTPSFNSTAPITPNPTFSPTV
ncbi:hypothetical protein CO009_03445 [Candidatus Shapirobacteria bacterium CG_4_8_14_3_um_filter_35_11]|uniref:Uncharacterized protein n=4 Tax=Candidatus Shapironibacteriota TaxID=1752721 RepID=A0A2M7XN13_9BACT|nr:MAG: hypothetical protein COS53_03110 [Candidatus Shapirobacteria bacterium CG03_land_8_20_14_0_80_35_14]PJA50951.1 MAG: hypothetical protein CO168_02385 [Candidatus Shapirobacteria bacterium CG_4_9_14_3_um_filter_36_12]PJC79773.1 MAG: hypothetical protein CO009_03445 [Candidatus Shapirobacteria bacterium CG_4_8_14_3_um_filter_35_11]PJE66610.1 MAG: hypothetical protein COU93_03390 [Candidatus Shapirobacteria bacterium CG10_big_fil_rev_8_21_14_0_10_36_6]